MNNFMKKFKELDSNSIIFEYKKYHLERMNPNFYDMENNKFESFESMMYHKDTHDKCMKIMISKHLEDIDIVNFLEEVISHNENLEQYENCSKIKKIQSEYESRIRS